MAVCLIAGPFVAGQATENESGADKSTGMSAAELMTREPAASDYVDEVDCINTRRIRNTTVLDDRHISLQVRKNEYYLVEFKSRCIGMRPNKAVILEARTGSSLCKHDAIRPIENIGLSHQPGVRCHIPGFQRVSGEQIAALKDSLEDARQRKKVERRAERAQRKLEKQQRREAKKLAKQQAS